MSGPRGHNLAEVNGLAVEGGIARHTGIGMTNGTGLDTNDRDCRGRMG